MLIGAYRNNEVDADHPLMRRLEAIDQAGATVQEIQLAPLACEHVRELISGCPSLRAGTRDTACAD